MQEWLDNNDILMYSTHNEVMSVIAEKSIKLLKAKIYKKKKYYEKLRPREIFIIYSVLKTNPWALNGDLKDLNGEKSGKFL